MQAALDHLSANETGKDSQASKEYSQADVIDLDNPRQHIRIFTHANEWMALKQSVNQNNEGGYERQKVNPGCAPGQKVSPHFNSHQPLEGPVAWYEAHLCSNEGWNIIGALFPGAPSILHGCNQYLGWAHTVNGPDKLDIYQLELLPAALKLLIALNGGLVSGKQQVENLQTAGGDVMLLVIEKELHSHTGL